MIPRKNNTPISTPPAPTGYIPCPSCTCTCGGVPWKEPETPEEWAQLMDDLTAISREMSRDPR